MMQLTTYLFFRNNASEAFDFYAKCLGASIATRVTIGEMPDSGNLPPATHGLMAHVRLEAGNATLMGSDWCNPAAGPYPGIHGNAVSLAVDTPDEAERLFKRLADGGKVTMPMAGTSWALRFGMLHDRFGVMWMVSCERPERGHA